MVFYPLLEQHRLAATIFAAVRELLEERRLLLRAGTIVDATIIAAPSSTKNAAATRDPEMKQIRKGRTWYFGMKLHVGADKRGIVLHGDRDRRPHRGHHPAAAILHGQEREIFGDQAYWKEADRGAFESRGARYRINRRPSSTPLSERWGLINRARSRTRACGEHAFRVLKQFVGFYQGQVPGAGQKPGPGADHVCAGQSLSTPARAASATGEVQPVTRSEITTPPLLHHHLSRRDSFA